ncbi:MAG: hypothetical protein Q4E45_04980 [Eubacteriales bacterium]|nr:hypothetical protein [Eubacteriales bacterium]
MDDTIFRKKSLDKISSPESLGDYLHVTNPSVWMILAAVILLLAGMLIWASTSNIDSYAYGTAQVENGNMRISFDDQQAAGNVESGLTVIIGETRSTVTGVGIDEAGQTFASASTTLADGSYPAKVLLRQTQVIRLLFN